MTAYVPSPTQVPNLLPGSESSSSESPPLVQGVDYDTFVYVHYVEVWVRHTCREQHENIEDWHRLEELSNAMHPAHEGCCQLKEASERQKTGMQTNQYWVSTTQAPALHG